MIQSHALTACKTFANTTLMGFFLHCYWFRFGCCYLSFAFFSFLFLVFFFSFSSSFISFQQQQQKHVLISSSMLAQLCDCESTYIQVHGTFINSSNSWLSIQMKNVQMILSHEADAGNFIFMFLNAYRNDDEWHYDFEVNFIFARCSRIYRLTHVAAYVFDVLVTVTPKPVSSFWRLVIIFRCHIFSHLDRHIWM